MSIASTLSDLVWTDILAYLRTRHPAISRGWFSQLEPGPLEHGELTILAANTAQIRYLSEHCLHPFVEAAQAATGRLVSVRFNSKGDSPPDTDCALPSLPGSAAPSFESESLPLRLNEDYVFENFVSGPCNRLAHASCLAVSESPGTVYNPLFIHGRVGLGKTHLLQAVCHRLLERSPVSQIVYLSCETFVNHFIEAIERGALNSFRYRYRHADLLVIDDVQFLAERDRTQEEFFHTFNTLYQAEKQIILSADCSPTEIPSLEERLVSRFNWGLVARIDAPGLETRLAIIRKKLKMREIELPEDVAMFVATRVKSNGRELEGALTRLQGIAALDGRKIDLALARRALQVDQDPPAREIRIQEIIGLVTERFDVKLSDLQGRRRNRSITLPRQVCMYLARQHTHHSLEEVGGFFGGRDHTTVLHACKLIAQRRQSDAGLRTQIDEIEKALLGPVEDRL